MSVDIHCLHLGYERTYIIQGNGFIMVDGGSPKQAGKFIKETSALGVAPKDIRLMIITHGHWDHIGSAHEIQQITEARLAMHRNEKDWLEQSKKPMPPGVTLWGAILSRIFAALLVPFVQIPRGRVDWVLEDEEYSLEEFGVSGKIIPTPGHSSGSVSVVLDSGEAFVGDLAMNAFPMRMGPGLPIFAEDWPRVIQSWKKLLGLGIHTVYPAHGDAFPVDVIKRALKKGGHSR